MADGAFSSQNDFDMSAFYRHVDETYANPHPQYRLAATPITGADITDGTVALLDLDASTQALITAATPTGVVRM